MSLFCRVNRIHLLQLPQINIFFKRSIIFVAGQDSDDFNYRMYFSTSPVNGLPHGEEEVKQQSLIKEKDRGYIMKREWNHGMLIGKETLNKFIQISSDMRMSNWDKCHMMEKFVMFEYEWKLSQPSTIEYDKQLNRLELLVDDQKWDDFDRHAVACLYKWLHRRWVLT